MSEFITNRTLDQSNLPTGVRVALKAAHAKRGHVTVQARIGAVDLRGSAGAGERAVGVVIPDAAVSQFELKTGSFGGPTPFVRGNPVDDGWHVEIPVKGAVIRGTYGGYCVVITTPETLASWLSYETDDATRLVARDAATEGRLDEVIPRPLATNDERCYLLGFMALKSGDYRRSYLAGVLRHHAGTISEASLCDRGLLAKSSNGATKITTLGRDALGDHRGCSKCRP